MQRQLPATLSGLIETRRCGRWPYPHVYL